MALKLYNTLTRSEQDFAASGEVKIYACGPTVYAPVHLGNWRTFLFADWLARTLRYLGHEVKLVMNITDVDDKTINGARESGVPLAEFTKKYEDLFLADRETLNIVPPAQTPHATAFVPAMIALIQTLLDRGLAYKADDGVYFAIHKFPAYGVLAGFRQAIKARVESQVPNQNTILPHSRVRNDVYDKENLLDFVLWKFKTPEDGNVFWKSESLGDGRPGWHLECSAMIKETLGETIDIHVGGSDLIFPHHTNEIAQSEGANGAPLAKFWLHGGFLNIAEEKMSKSLGNIFTLNDLKEKGSSPLDYRYFLLSTHYRKIANFTWEALEGAQTAYQKLLNTVSDLAAESQGATLKTQDQGRTFESEFVAALEADLNFPQALALVWELIKDETIPSPAKLATLLKWDEVLGLNLALATQTDPIPENIQKLVADRELARQNNDFSLADELREEISKLGYTVEDKTDGPKVRKN